MRFTRSQWSKSARAMTVIPGVISKKCGKDASVLIMRASVWRLIPNSYATSWRRMYWLMMALMVAFQWLR